MLAGPAWIKWWQTDLPCAFSQARAEQNCAYLTALLSSSWLEKGVDSPGYANHPVFQRWKGGGANAFLELNTLAEDAKVLDQVPGFDQVVADLRDIEGSEPAWHVIHAAAMFERAAPKTVIEFLAQVGSPIPDFRMRAGGKIISCEAKALMASDKEQAFYDFAVPLVEKVFAEVLTSFILHPTVLIVLKDADKLPEISAIVEAVDETRRRFDGSQIAFSSANFNVFVEPIPPLTRARNLGEHRLCYVLCPRSPNENLRVEDRSKKAARQLRSLAESTAGLFCLRVSHYQNPHVILNLLNRRFARGQYRAMSGVMLLRTGTHLAPPKRTPVDLVATAHNPMARPPLPNLPMRGVGPIGSLLEAVAPEGPVPAYHYSDAIAGGTGSIGVFVPDLCFLTEDML